MKGFKFAGVAAGIKKTGVKDLGLIYTQKPPQVPPFLPVIRWLPRL